MHIVQRKVLAGAAVGPPPNRGLDDIIPDIVNAADNLQAIVMMEYMPRGSLASWVGHLVRTREAQVANQQAISPWFSNKQLWLMTRCCGWSLS